MGGVSRRNALTLKLFFPKEKNKYIPLWERSVPGTDPQQQWAQLSLTLREGWVVFANTPARWAESTGGGRGWGRRPAEGKPLPALLSCVLFSHHLHGFRS